MQAKWDLARSFGSLVRRLFLFLFVITLAQAVAQQNAIDPETAAKYFAEMKAADSRDGGHLWGVPLYGPMLFVDPDTSAAVANQPDAQGKLSKQGSVFVGQVPPDLGAANTAIDWAGVHWTMVMWPLPEHQRDRVRLMAHECFHRIQEQVGLNPIDAVNNHLDSRDGRIWLQLEFRALERALWANGDIRQQTIADALYFRAYRRSLFPNAAEHEDALELSEGVAEYTGVTIAAHYPGDAMSAAEVKLRLAADSTSFARSFAYTTGPAYGYLLDQSGKPWRKQLRSVGSLSSMLANAYKPEMPPVAQAEAVRRAQPYDGDDTISLENAREAHHQKDIADAKAKFIDGPVLVLPLGPDVRYTFNPHGLLALDNSMTMYPTTQVTDQWGTLHVDDGALLIRGNNRMLVRAQVRAPADGSKLQGEGWKLDLKPGWKLEKGERPGDWKVVKVGGG